jgi:hypothetical protein
LENEEMKKKLKIKPKKVKVATGSSSDSDVGTFQNMIENLVAGKSKNQMKKLLGVDNVQDSFFYNPG